VSLDYLSEVHLMSENLVIRDALQDSDSALNGISASAGQMIKQARLDAGLHIAALAVSLRVPIKRIEALENGQMDLLPDIVFVRALTSSICQALKIDAVPILDKLPRAALPRLNRDDVAINTPIGVSGASKSPLLSDIVTSPWLMGVAFLCIASAGVYFWPKETSSVVSEIVTHTKSLPEAGIAQAKEQLVTAENIMNVSTSAPTGVASPSNNLVLATASISAAADVDNSGSGSVSNSVLPADSIVIFKASAEAWVEVKNALGSTIFKKLLNTGEAAGVAGALPLTVIVGRADVTQVEVRGKPFDLKSIAKSNVARFEVK
jgi:cytoskeleton protein RodZ